MKRVNEYVSVNEERAIQVFIEILTDKFSQEIEDIRLFGSKARGEATLDSDLDILVLVKSSDYSLKHAILWLAAEISLTYDVLLSPRVVPEIAWQQMTQGNTLFYRTICAEGIPLFTPTQTVLS
ncbi:MAG: nucleotidyltransferase domain-containing protein [Anaerolineales bacterium]|nr:nucleotidyltransferase domain-containing protein [Anaerolineales bacterium]